MDTDRRCISCNQCKPLSEFYYHSVRKTFGRRCKDCVKQQQKQKYTHKSGYHVTMICGDRLIQYDTANQPTSVTVLNKSTGEKKTYKLIEE